MTVYLSLGSNIEPEKNLPACVEILKIRFRVLKVSSIYETDPVGPAGNQKFCNMAVAVETGLDTQTLSRQLREIEAKLGRKRAGKDKFAPRPIDIDTVPTPGYTDHFFVMVPLAEIAPEERDPVSRKTFREIAKKWENSAGWRKIESKS